MLRKIGLIAWASIVLLTACAPTQGVPEGDQLATMVAATLQAMTPLSTPEPGQTPLATPPAATATGTATVTATATPGTAEVIGRVCYPAGVTSMKAFFQETQTGGAAELLLNGEAEYTTQLPPGSYVAYAWLPDFSRSVAYTSSDHTLKAFTVNAGQKLSGIDLCDLYPAYNAVPFPPGYSPAAITGAVSGSINAYPGDANARLLVVITNRATQIYEYTYLLPGTRFYTFTQLTPGQYGIVVYDVDGRRGGAGPITVTAGVTANGDVNDWSGSYSDKPASILFP